MSHAGRVVGSALAALGAVAVGAFAYGVLVERNRFVVRRETVPILDAGGDPIRVLHLSDIHLAPWQERKQQWIRSLAELRPDLVVSTGDNTGHVDSLPALARTLEAFRGVPGVFVHGSNDFYGPELKNPFGYFSDGPNKAATGGLIDTEALEAIYGSLGWHDLNNGAVALAVKGSRLEFVGVGDPHRNLDKLHELPGILDELREDVDWGDDREGVEPVTIALTHAPYQRVLDSFVNHGADLIVAGHTHGGQVRVPGVGALVANCDIPLDQASGLSVWQHGRGSSFLNVSAGLGTSIFAPVRFACPPEAVLLTLSGDDFGYP